MLPSVKGKIFDRHVTKIIAVNHCAGGIKRDRGEEGKIVMLRGYASILGTPAVPRNAEVVEMDLRAMLTPSLLVYVSLPFSSVPRFSLLQFSEQICLLSQSNCQFIITGMSTPTNR